MEITQMYETIYATSQLLHSLISTLLRMRTDVFLYASMRLVNQNGYAERRKQFGLVNKLFNF